MKLKKCACRKGGKCLFEYRGEICGADSVPMLRYYQCTKCKDGYSASVPKKRK